MNDWRDSSKYASIEKIGSSLEPLRQSGKRIVQCHGTFDLLHPGHLIHFEEAKQLGDVLVVSFTSEAFVDKGPGRPYFNDALRFKSLASLECVDYVVPIPFPAAVEAIKAIQPNVYCKGKEYENHSNDVTGNISDDVRAVQHVGGETVYVGSVVFSSTRLLNRNFDTYSSKIGEFCSSLARTCPPNELRKEVDAFARIKTLVIGDVIFDRYTTVGVQGLTSKNRILSARHMTDDTQAGGALAVLRHLRDFSSQVKLIGLVGAEDWVEDELKTYISPEGDGLIRDEFFTTIVKQRFIEEQKSGAELSKLFSVNYIDKENPPRQVEEKLLACVSREIENYDLVLVMDFGHGVLSDRLRDLVQERARFLALNCQTNSNNYGFNIINRRYCRADSFSLDNAEMTLAHGRRRFDHSDVLTQLREELGARAAWLTRGEVETIGQDVDGNQVRLPPFENRIVDTIGAGDAFCSLASLATVSGLPIEVSTFLGQLAGGQAVRYAGNREHINKASILKAAFAMLNV